MSDYPEIAARFARETEHHEMAVLLDQGLYRHLRFMNPKYSFYWFELVTVPGALIFQGDGDAFVFRRVEDMLVFFRHGIHENGSRRINPGYWDEKLQAEPESVKCFSRAKFAAHVAEVLAEAEETHPGVTKAWREEIEEGWDYDLDVEASALQALRDFEFGDEGYRGVCTCGAVFGSYEDRKSYRDVVLWSGNHLDAGEGKHVTRSESLVFSFEDWPAWDLTDFHWWYLWACHAILWGIQQYDAWRLTVPAHRPEMPTTYEFDDRTWDLTLSYYDDCGEVWENQGWWLGDEPLMWSVDSNGKHLEDAPVPFREVWNGDLQVLRATA